MALFPLQRRLGIVLKLIGLLSIAPGTIEQVDAVPNVPIPGPYIQFVLLPPPRIIISQNHTPIFLACSASFKNEIVETSSNYEFPFYSWLRNDEPILLSPRNEFHVFENGTLKILAATKAAASYRCIANGTEIDAGVLLSTETIVEIAVLKRFDSSPTNLTAIIGEPTVLQCPILSLPKANVSWSFDNKSIKTVNNRFLHLKNGGLLIKNTTAADQGKFKCIAKNSFSSRDKRQFTWTVNVEYSPTSNKSGLLLPPLQNEVEYIEAGKTLKLHCASYSEDISWWFTSRSQSNSFKISNHSNEIFLKHVTVEQHDGFFRCATQLDFQIFNVIVSSTPLIDTPLETWEKSLAEQVSLRCNAFGNPPPSITWFRNGVQLQNSYTIQYTPPVLRINSVDLKDEGIYQCFAKNIAGESVKTILLSLRRKDELPNLPNRPENVQCYPVNYKTLFVTFSGSPTLYMVTPSIVTENPFNWNVMMPTELDSNSNFTLSQNIPVLKPFVLFMRGLVTTSTQTSNGLKKQTFDVSLLSDPTNCSTQGLEVNPIFIKRGIFIWWTPIENVLAKYFIVQFWNNDRNNAINFENTIVGTVDKIGIEKTEEEINAMLLKISVLNTTNTEDVRSRKKRSISRSVNSKQNFEYSKKTEPRFSRDSNFSNITEVGVAGNVTGVLIPNAHSIKVRVLMITAENEHLKQNIEYVEWKAIENTTNTYNFIFRVDTVESRSIAVSWNRLESISCIKTCYINTNWDPINPPNQQSSCQEIKEPGPSFEIKKLMPGSLYRVKFMNCTTSRDFGMVEVETKPDAPGPITNQKISTNNGLKLSWDPPTNPNGQIFYYNILWTVHNSTYNANLTDGLNLFQFPNVTEDDKINITIRAIGSSGIGLPIYMDSKDFSSSVFGNDKTLSSDSTLGIVVGIILSVFCVLIFILIFIKQRGHFKSRTFRRQRSSASPTESHCPPQTASSNIELREMQTLIPKPPALHIMTNMDGLPRNGICYSEPDDETETADNLRDISKTICSSTPKIPRKHDINETPLKYNGTTMSTNSALLPSAPIAATTIINKNSSSPNFYISQLHSNGNSTKYQNGSIKTALPPNKHSIAAVTTEPKLVKANGNLKIADISQYSSNPNSNASTLDNSRHKLLDTSLDSCKTNEHNDSGHHHQHHPNNHQTEMNDSNTTATTTVDMDDSIQNYSCNPIKNNSWNYRRPIIDPNG